MPPAYAAQSNVSSEFPNSDDKAKVQSSEKSGDVEILWIQVGCYIVLLHIMALYGLILLPKLKLLTFVWIVFCYIIAGAGVTMGAHRLWAHRSYKAKWPLRFLLMLANSMAAQGDIIGWCRVHRVHHKYTDTDADPHNSKRGFFFCHLGWLLQKEHPDVVNKLRAMDVSDLYADEIVMFQKRYFKVIALTMCVVVPTLVPYLWGESLWLSFFTAFALRYLCSAHATWSVNSFAHMFGDTPYDVNITATTNPYVSFIAWGEGFHNYHHTFPQDYSASEFGTKLNITTRIINFFAWIGWVYDRKTVPKEVVLKRMMRTGKLRLKSKEMN